jgi:hypothetical protein
VCGGQTSPHKPRLVVSHSTCPPLSSSPHAHTFVLGTAVTNNNSGVGARAAPGGLGCREEEEEEEEEDLFVFNDTIEGPRAPTVKPGRTLKPDESEGCSPVSGGRTIRMC